MDLRSIVQAGALYIETPGIRLHEFHNWQSSHSLTGLREHPEPPGLSPTLILKRRFLPDATTIRRQSPYLKLNLVTIFARRAAGRQPSVSIASLNRTILSSTQLRNAVPKQVPVIPTRSVSERFTEKLVNREFAIPHGRLEVMSGRHECSPKVIRDCSYVTRVPLAIV